ncbi:29267_t:CDS:1, partial [Racocetra persica]
KKRKLKSSNNKTIKSISSSIENMPSFYLDINNESSLHLNAEHTSSPPWIIENTESTPSPPWTIENISSLSLKIKNITYYLLDDEISSDIDDSESDRNEFIYDMHNLKEAVFSKFRNEEIDDL